MGNVWRPNIFKHCLVTKHADVEVSGQTVKTCLIKPLSKCGTHAKRQTCLIRLSKRSKHRPSNTFDGLQTRPNTITTVWRPNTIKHCLVTKHANVEASGQTVKTCLMKHRSNNWYKPLSKCHGGTHARIKHFWYAAIQTNKTSPIKHESKRNNLSFWSNVWWPSNFIKHDQTRLSTIKHDQQHQTRVQTVKYLVAKQCLMVFGRQTFLVCPGPKVLIECLMAFKFYSTRPNTIKHEYIHTVICLVTKQCMMVFECCVA